MMMVSVMIVVHHVVCVVRVGDQAGTGDSIDDGCCGHQRRIVGDVNAAANQIEADGGNAGPVQRAPNQRRFIGAVHAGDVQPEDSGLGHYSA